MSDNYRALTRTYRPRTFDDIVSQRHVSDTLKNAIKQNRLAHAYMFCGPRGVGKTTMARVLARTVNSIEQEVDGESLNQTLNVIEIDAASNNGVDDIRDLRDRVRIPPQNGRYKIYIIDEVHMLSKAAFNALLKTLEEPPDHVIFIFATTEPHKVLPTILSRVQRFDFKRISIDEIVSRLQTVTDDEGISVDEESLHVIAKKADGALRDALGLLDQVIAFCGDDIEHEELLQALNVVSTDRMFQFMQTVEAHDAAAGLELINDLLQEGYDIQEFLVGLTEHLRNLYVAHQSDSMYLVEASDRMKGRYKETSTAFSEDDLMRMLHIVSEAQYKIRDAHQPRIQFEITLLKLIHMKRTQKLDTLIKGLQELKKKNPDQHIAADAASEKPAATADEPAPPAEAAEPEPAEEPDASPSTEPEPASEEPIEAAAPKDPVMDEPPADQAETETDTEVQAEQPEPTSPSLSADDTEDAGPPQEQPAAQGASNGPSFEGIFGTPSINNGANATAAVQEQAEPANGEIEEAPAADNGSSSQKHISLNDVKETWDAYVMDLKDNVQQMLYFQMQRVEPVKLKNRKLLLQCSDTFAQQMVEEHKRELAKMLEKKVGGFLQFSCKVTPPKKDKESSMSPYERFKQLQERDPKIKTLVELFGAELDYNLNR